MCSYLLGVISTFSVKLFVKCYFYLQCVVPASSTQSSAIRGHPQTADPILVGVQDWHTVTFKDVPDIDGVVVVSPKQKSTCYTTKVELFLYGIDQIILIYYEENLQFTMKL